MESWRIVITDVVCNMSRTVIHTTPEDLVPVVYLAANKLSPTHDGLKLGIGESSIITAIAKARGHSEDDVKKRFKEEGDLGIVAPKSRPSQLMLMKSLPLMVTKVFDKFHALAKEAGENNQKKKRNHIKELLVAATDCEPQFLIRLLQLRIGLAEQTLLAALEQAAVFTETNSTPSPHTLEEIHYMEDGSVEIFSRNGERNTEKFPDVVVAVKKLEKESSMKSFVLDCELVAYDLEKAKILPFQILRTRTRKNVSLSDIKIPAYLLLICCFLIVGYLHKNNS